ncbi:MAG: ATP-binding protein [Lachnospiraceae bacterium]|nr:ATP-binding protein [Lachnospiraceae bacterium]
MADEETISYSEPETIPVPDIPIHNITQDTVHPSDQIKDRLPETLSVLPDCQTEEPVTLNLISFCETMVQEFIHLYGLFPSQVQILSEEKSILLSTKKTLLTLIIQNLIDNAAKYVKYDSRHAARFTLTLSKQDSAIIMIFRNNTCGVSPAEIPNLTTRNYQGSNRISGTGLGLFQAEAAVNILQGSLQIKSSPGTGFAVYLQLPELTGHPENSLSKKEDTNETA